jgi:hypothetical protein
MVLMIVYRSIQYIYIEVDAACIEPIAVAGGSPAWASRDLTYRYTYTDIQT